MTAADTYRRYAAECVSMSRRRENVRDKVLHLQMATMWPKLAETKAQRDHLRLCEGRAVQSSPVS